VCTGRTRLDSTPATELGTIPSSYATVGPLFHVPRNPPLAKHAAPDSRGPVRSLRPVPCGQRKGTIMSIDRERQLEVLCRQLNESIMRAALCVKEIATIVQAEGDGGARLNATSNGRQPTGRVVGFGWSMAGSSKRIRRRQKRYGRLLYHQNRYGSRFEPVDLAYGRYVGPETDTPRREPSRSSPSGTWTT